ncbi:Alpha/Beta hydrolase protein [Paraphysoderma sedebokerense]|nr:Alpha/Beta hydrolase protein [Paraphysoderma sedebokerense]
MKILVPLIISVIFLFQIIYARPAPAPQPFVPAFLFPLIGGTEQNNSLLQVTGDSELTARLKEFGNYAASSYCTVRKLQDFNCNNCVPRLQPEVDQFQIIENKTMGALSYVRYHYESNTIVVAFRGTENMQNWQNNAKISTVTYKSLFTNMDAQVYNFIPDDAAIHRGFWQTFDSMKDNLTSVVQGMWTQAAQSGNLLPLSIATTGHSLGGAMAALAALHFQQSLNLQKDQIVTYTFSQPRVGNAAFVDYYDSLITTIRVTNGNDPIVHAPARGFQHFGTEIYADLQNKLWVCPQKEDNRCSGQFNMAFNPGKHSNIAALGFSTTCK